MICRTLRGDGDSRRLLVSCGALCHVTAPESVTTQHRRVAAKKRERGRGFTSAHAQCRCAQARHPSLSRAHRLSPAPAGGTEPTPRPGAPARYRSCRGRCPAPGSRRSPGAGAGAGRRQADTARSARPLRGCAELCAGGASLGVGRPPVALRLGAGQSVILHRQPEKLAILRD